MLTAYLFYRMSPLTTIAVAISTFYPLYLLLFYASILFKWGRFYKYGLLFGASSYLVSGLTFATRDVFIFFGLSILFTYFTFWNVLSKKVRARARIAFFLGAIILSIFFALFTVQRFMYKQYS